MSLALSSPLQKFGAVLFAALALSTATGHATTPPSETGTITFTLSGLESSDQHSFSVQNFTPSFGSLEDVTFTIDSGGKMITIFDAANPANNWIDVSLNPAGHPFVSGTDLAAWGDSLAALDISYKRSSKSIASDGVGGFLLFSAPAQGSAPFINVNYVYDITNTNPNTTPEPKVGYLAAIALAVMSWLIWSRQPRRVTVSA